MIKDNIKLVKDNIKSACNKTERKFEDVTLIDVSKTKPIEMLKEAYDAGERDFGENYVQELLDKIPQMPEDVRWHMIGHLQTNKVKYIVGKVFLIHSVDTLHLAQAISKESVKKDVVTHILVEINVAGEESKFGTSDMSANLEMIKDIFKLPNIVIKGLMTSAPYTEDPETNRDYFKQLYEFANKEAKDYIEGTAILSMGMTGDYVVAVEEGATMVRVGTGIFGERDYSNRK